MLTSGINFINFKKKQNNKQIKKKLVNLIKENNSVIKSLSEKYKDSFDKKFLKKFSKSYNLRLLGMGGSSLGSQAIYQFLKHKVKKNFEFIDNLKPRYKLNKKKFTKIIKNYDYIVDGTDNFKTKFLLNKFSLKYKKKLIIGAISKFEGHIFTFDFNIKKIPCLKCFYQGEPAEGVLNCETDGILGSTAVITGGLQANEVLKIILNIGKNLNSHILIIDLLNLKFRKVLFKKRKGCICENI